MTLDVRARLAEGAAIIDGQAQQIQDWYYAEDGLRLDALDADSAALAAAASASEEAWQVQRDALTVLTEGWRGGTGSGAVDFVARHCAAAACVVAQFRTGAAVLSALGENLAHVVDSKVDAVLGGDFSGGVTAANSASAAAYGEAITRLDELPAPRFETPLPPVTMPDDPGPVRSMPPPAPPPPPESPPVPPQQSAASWAPGLPPVGMPDIAGSLAGLVNQIAQALGSYSDVPAEPITGPQSDPADPALEDPVPEDPVPAQPGAEDPAPADPTPEGPAPEVPVADVPVTDVNPVVPERQSPPDVPLAAEAPLPASPLPEMAAPPPPAEPAAVDTTATPCEIAADELPQVGE